MAQGAAAPWQFLAHTPGNPQLPTLPGSSDPVEGLDDLFGGLAGITIIPETFLGVHAAGPDTTRGFAQTWINEIWTSPQPLFFGDITADVDREVTIHNTYSTTITLTSIDVSAVPGVSVTSPSLPVDIDPFSSLIVTLTAAQSGSSGFDGLISFVFSVGTIPLRVIGQRVLLLDNHPEAGIVEQLQFRTKLQRSRNATENARASRITPRRNLRMLFGFDDDEERTRFDSLYLGAGPSLLFAVPQFQEARELSAAALSTDTAIFMDTTTASFEAGAKVHFRLVDETYTNADIDSVESDRLNLVNPVGIDLPANTLCMPVFNGRMTGQPDLSIAAVNFTAMAVGLTFWDEPPIGTSAPLSLTTPHPVDGLPILTAFNVIENGNKTGSFRRNEKTLDNNTGPIFVRGTEPIAEFGSEFQSTARTMAEIYAWRQFVHYLYGSWRKFYVPTYQNDLPASTALTITANYLDVPNMGITRFLNARAPRRDLRFQYPGGVEYTRISSVVDNGATERLNLNPALTNTELVQPEDLRVSWLNLCRIGGDVITFRHSWIGRASVIFRYRTTTE